MTQPGDGELTVGYHLDGTQSITRIGNSSPGSFAPTLNLAYEAAFSNTKLHNLTVELLKVEGPFKGFVVTGIAYDFTRQVEEIGRVEDLPDIPLSGGDPTPPSDPASSPDLTQSSSSTGIAVGSLAAVLLVVAAIVLCLRLRNRRFRKSEPTVEDIQGGTDENNTLQPTSYEKSYHFDPFLPSLPRHDDATATSESSTPNLNDLQPVRSSYPTALHDYRSHASLPTDDSGPSSDNSQPQAPSPYNSHLAQHDRNNSPLVNLVVDLLNTHYESLTQPPAYPASSAAPSVDGDSSNDRAICAMRGVMASGSDMQSDALSGYLSSTVGTLEVCPDLGAVHN